MTLPRRLTTVLLLLLPATVSAQPVRIASFATQVPGDPNNFTGFGLFPSLSNGTVAFVGGNASRAGIFTGSGGPLGTVVTTSTPVPGIPANFSTFGDPVISNGQVVFAGGPPGPGPTGVYTGVAGGTSTAVAAQGQSAPGGGVFTNFASTVSVSNGLAGFFAGTTLSPIGVYVADGVGTPKLIANSQTFVPGTSGRFTSLQSPTVSFGSVAFYGAGGGRQGVYANFGAGGALAAVADTATAVADTATAVPGGTGTFTAFAVNVPFPPPFLPQPGLSGTNVAFQAQSTGRLGIYANTGAGGSLIRVADTTTPSPTNGQLFTAFDPTPAISGSVVVLTGSNAGAKGIYTNFTGSLTEIISTGDLLDGRTVTNLSVGTTGFDGTQVAFWAQFNDFSQGVYLTPVPEPATVLGLAALGLAVGRGVRQRVARRFV